MALTIMTWIIVIVGIINTLLCLQISMSLTTGLP